MTRTLVLGVVLAAFSVLNLAAFATYGYIGSFEVLFSTLPGTLVTVDVVISVTLILLWMWTDARERGLPFWPYAIVALLLGSVGTLAYLIHRELRGRAMQAVEAVRKVPV